MLSNCLTNSIPSLEKASQPSASAKILRFSFLSSENGNHVSPFFFSEGSTFSGRIDGASKNITPAPGTLVISHGATPTALSLAFFIVYFIAKAPLPSDLNSLINIYGYLLSLPLVMVTQFLPAFTLYGALSYVLISFGTPRIKSPEEMVKYVHNNNAHLMTYIWASCGPWTE